MNRTKHYVWNYWLLTATLIIGALSPLFATSNCDNLSFDTNNTQISISGLTTTSKVEIIGQNTNWEVITICDGDCLPSTTIPNLTEGEYSVKVNLIDSQGNCYREEKVSLEEQVEEMNPNCQSEISATGTDARILCFEVDNDGITTLNIVENGSIYQKQLDKDGNVISSESIGNLAIDSVLIEGNQIIKKLANGTIEFTKSIPDALLDKIPNIEAVNQLTDGSFILAGFQTFFNPDFGLETNDSLLIVLTDANLNFQNAIVETENGGPNVIRFDRVNRIIPRPNNQFIIYYSKGVQGPVLIDVFKNFTKYQKTDSSLERLQDFRTVGILRNQVNISPCNNFLITDTETQIVTIKSSSSSKGFLRLDLNNLGIIEGGAIGTRSVDFLGTKDFYSYSYKANTIDEFSTLSVGYLENGLTNQVDLSKMEIRFFNNSDIPIHRKTIPSIEFDRVIRTGDTTCLVLFKNNGGLFGFNPDCKIPASTANCQMLQFITDNNQITIEGLSADYNKVEIIGRNTDWQVIPICDDDCSPTLVIPDLELGECAVKVNQSGNDGSYCYHEEKVIVTEGNMNTSSNCDNLNFLISDGLITIEGLTASYDKVEIIGRNTDWQVISICDGDCDDTQIISDLAAGEYSVKVNQGGADGSYCYREQKVIVENGSDIRNSEFEFSDDLLLYPNPARDRVNVQLPSLDFQKGAVHIYNVFGQQVLTTSLGQFNQEVLTIDLGGFENGMYVMTVQLGGAATFSRRFVVEHLR